MPAIVTLAAASGHWLAAIEMEGEMNKKQFVAAALLVLSAQAEASVVYTYVGKNFTSFFDQTPPSGAYDSSMKVAGSITLANALPLGFTRDLSPLVLDFSFSDGRGTLNKSNSLFRAQFAQFQVDGLGNITGWSIGLRDRAKGFPVLAHAIATSSAGTFDLGNIVSCTNLSCSSATQDLASPSLPGVWQRQSAVPLPGALGLLSMGIVGLAKLRGKFREV